MTVNTKANIPLNKMPLFITGRFRSGSTMLWNLFRQLQEVRSFYEPLHDQLVSYIKHPLQPQREHFFVKSYFDEYQNIPDIVSLHQNDFANHRLLLEGSDVHPELHTYIQALAESVPSAHQIVLQFNRIDFRLAWIKKNFPNAKLLHIFRDPRDQWYSSLTRFSGDIDNFIDFNQYYLATWARDLYRQFPFLVSSKLEHAYQRFYFIWKLSYLAGQRLSDLSVAYEDVLAEPEEFATKILRFSNLYTDKNLEACLKTIISKPERAWTMDKSDDWFLVIEQKCEQVLDELGLNKNFSLMPLSEIQQSSPKYQGLLFDPENDAWAARSFTQAVAREQSAVFDAHIAHEQTRKQLDDVWADRDAIRADRDRIQAEREHFYEEMRSATIERDQLQLTLNSVVYSRSWKLTSPLRVAMSVARKVIRWLLRGINKLAQQIKRSS